MIRFYHHRVKAVLPWIAIVLFVYCWYFYREREFKKAERKKNGEIVTFHQCCSQSSSLQSTPQAYQYTDDSDEDIPKTTILRILKSADAELVILPTVIQRSSAATTTTAISPPPPPPSTPATTIITTSTTTTTTTAKALANRITTHTIAPQSMPLKTATKKVTLDPMDEYHFNDTMTFPGYPDTINPHPFDFTMNPSHLCNDTDAFLLLLIHSHPGNVERRQVVRETWGNTSWYKSTVVLRVFIMGETLNPVHSHLLKMENILYKDIVQENFLDTYRNLTYKAIAGLKWVTFHCSNVNFILKADDDAFINMFVVLRHLKSKLKYGHYGNGTLACNAWFDEPVARKGKWAVTLAQRKHKYWPTFCQGLSYIYTPDVASAFYSVSFNVPYLWMDDVYVTGFLARRLRIKHVELDTTFVHEANLTRCITGPQWYRCMFSHVNNLNVTVAMWKILISKPYLPL